jgi:hypothetical protein
MRSTTTISTVAVRAPTCAGSVREKETVRRRGRERATGLRTYGGGGEVKADVEIHGKDLAPPPNRPDTPTSLLPGCYSSTVDSASWRAETGESLPVLVGGETARSSLPPHCSSRRSQTLARKKKMRRKEIGGDKAEEMEGRGKGDVSTGMCHRWLAGVAPPEKWRGGGSGGGGGEQGGSGRRRGGGVGREGAAGAGSEGLRD